jgi:hypothetical protein
MNFFFISVKLIKPDGGYRCNCFNGFTGQQCQDTIDICRVGVDGGQQPCLNNGTCVSTPGSFYCLCIVGYTGTRCENQFNPCASQPCVRGNCVNLPNNTFGCECPRGIHFYFRQLFFLFFYYFNQNYFIHPYCLSNRLYWSLLRTRHQRMLSKSGLVMLQQCHMHKHNRQLHVSLPQRLYWSQLRAHIG